MDSMEAVNIVRIQSMRRHMKDRTVIKLCQYLLVLVCFCLFLSSPLWLPRIVVFTDRFLFVLLPAAGRRFLGPRCIFMLGNLIIVFLVGDSKLSGKRPRPSPDGNYESMPSLTSYALKGPEPRKEEEPEEEEEDDNEREDEEEEEEKNALPADELKRRVEDFIARVYSQRSREASLIAGRAA